MKVFLVRHAKAEKRGRWAGPDGPRPLVAAGWRQAHGLVTLLDDVPVARVVSSPLRRCRQTLEPLARAHRLPIEIDTRLSEGTPVRRVLDLIESLGDEPAVLCSHGDVIPELLETLLGEEHDAESVVCEKGSVWELEGKLDGPLRASYRAPRKAEKALELPGERARAPAAEGPSRIGVLDLGSTSFHLIVVEREGEELRRVKREGVMLRLGAELACGPAIDGAVCDRAVETALALRKVAETAKAEVLIPVATAALREASNGRELAARLSDALDAPVWILDGEQEARVIFAALRARLPRGPEPVLGIDLGGGSLELAIGVGHDVLFEKTLRLGVARLHGAHVRSDPPRKKELAVIRSLTETELASALPAMRQHRPARFAAVGGTVRALARLLRAGTSTNGDLAGMRISRTEIAALERELCGATHDERLALPGMDERRADLLPVGAVIVATLLDTLEIESFEVCDWGLREGIALQS